MPDVGDGAVDVVDLTQSLADILEEQINNDLNDTGYTVAPVMPWPIALAMGTQLPLGDRLGLLELQDIDGSRSTRSGSSSRRDPDCTSSRRWTSPGDRTRQRVGVWIALTKASARHDPVDWFAELGVTDRVRLDPRARTRRATDRC